MPLRSVHTNWPVDKEYTPTVVWYDSTNPGVALGAHAIFRSSISGGMPAIVSRPIGRDSIIATFDIDRRAAGGKLGPWNTTATKGNRSDASTSRARSGTAHPASQPFQTGHGSSKPLLLIEYTSRPPSYPATTTASSRGRAGMHGGRLS